jgi:HAD superfamily hydrolase (TIGR01509 family)
MRDFAAVIFDMDGLMIDSESAYWAAGRKLAESYGKKVSDQTLGRMMGRKPIESMQVFANELGLDVSPQALLHARDSSVFATLQQSVTPMPGLLEALQMLRSRFKLAIATSAIRRFVDVVIEHLALHGYFDLIQTSDDVAHGKPDPEIYLKAMAKLKIEPARCAVFEDSSNGALAGKRSGAYTVAVPSIYTREQDFSFVDFTAHDLLDAAGHILALQQQAEAARGR